MFGFFHSCFTENVKKVFLSKFEGTVGAGLPGLEVVHPSFYVNKMLPTPLAW